MLAKKIEDNVEGIIIQILTKSNKKIPFSMLVSETNELSSNRVPASKVRRAINSIILSNPDLIDLSESSSGEPTYKALISKEPESSIVDADMVAESYLSDEDVADTLDSPKINKYIVLDEFKKKKWSTSERLSDTLGIDEAIIENILDSLVSSDHLILKDVEFEEGKVYSIGSNSEPLEDDYYIVDSSDHSQDESVDTEESVSNIELTDLDYEIYNNLIEKSKSIGVLKNRCVKAGFKSTKTFQRRLDTLVAEEFVGIEGNKYYATQYFMDYIESESNAVDPNDDQMQIVDAPDISTEDNIKENDPIEVDSDITATKSSINHREDSDKTTLNVNTGSDLSSLVRKIAEIGGNVAIDESMTDELNILMMFIDLSKKYAESEANSKRLETKMEALTNIINA